MPLRFITLIGGLAVGFILLLNAAAESMGTWVGGESADTGTILLMSLLYFLAGGFAIARPSISMALFAMAALLGLLMSANDFPELRFYGGVAVALTVTAFLGWRGVGDHA